MRIGGLARLTWTEIKLFYREPLALVFAFAFPLMILVLLLGIFGDEGGGRVFFGATGVDFYVPAYIATVVGSVTMVSMPMHLAGYLERGILRRFRSSGASAGMVLGALAIVAFLTILIGAALVVGLAAASYGLGDPVDIGGVLAGFFLGALAFLAFGCLIAVISRTQRSAQAIGLLAFFGMFFISGAGPPRGILPDWMVTLGDWLPLTYLVEAMQNPWIGRPTEWVTYAVLGGVLVIGGGLALALARRS